MKKILPPLNKDLALLDKLLKKIPISNIKKLIKAAKGTKPPLAKTSSKIPSKDKSPTGNKWVPSLEDSTFLRTFCFVLLSILEDPKAGIDNDFYQRTLKQASATYHHLIEHHGITGGSKKWKEQVQYIVLLAENRNPDPLPWVAVVKGGRLPEKLDALQPLLSFILARGESWQKGYQALITILAFARLSKEIPELDLKSIVEPRTSPNDAYQELLKDFRLFIKESRVKFRPVEQPISFNVTPRMRMTQGPNAEVTLASSVKEARSLLQNKVLGKSFELFCTHTGNKDLFSYVKALHDIHVEDTQEVRMGRLALVPDALNKHRLIAMVDY